jgi:hypothetical protein
MRTILHVRKDFMYDGLPLFIGQTLDNGQHIAHCVNFVMKEVTPGELIPHPSLVLDREDAQVLMDDLFRAGVRPTEGEGSAGSFSAQHRHLEDMRTLVSKALKIELK